MKKVNPKFKKLVKELCQKHAWNIGVSHYTMDILYLTEDKREDGFDVRAEMDTDRRYLRATLKVRPIVERTWKKDGAAQVGEVIAHEIAHIATQHVMDLMTSCYKDEGETKDAWESLTEMIARMSLKK